MQVSFMRSFFIIALIFLSACVSEPLPDGFKDSDDFDPVVAAKNRISLGLTYLKNGNFSQAKFNLDKALQFAPRLADAHYGIAYYYQRVDETELASEAFQKALAFAPNNPDIANSYGAFLCQQGQYQQAKKYFLKAVNSDNYISTAETYENLALCSQSQGQVDDAMEYLQSALNHQPSRSQALLLLIQLQMQQQQWSEAKQNLRRLEKISNVSAETLWMSVNIENALGNADLAKGYGDMLIAMYPTHQRTLSYIKNRQQFTVPSSTAKISKQLKPETAEIDQQDEKVDNQPDATGNPAAAQLNNVAPEPGVVAQSDQQQPELVKQPAGKVTNKENEATQFHVVQKGENLYRISLKYNVKIQRLVEWNDLQDSAAIYVGKRLIVVDPETVE
ncbi:type IV pilus biogenesis/stability protein PilW [Aliiglaciecola sp. LCG003]|uniref:type IV pilus biogenesis/stability protein PilW n=1 Tax=Aliiglaciecola sp. LCG003 TaxID=3053655 RepID=UPI0025743832|nr:type IV pilus biogenesis/stability protein PilW [Aliiglaciecola sp. LCG003]WJG10512.1 type IV pilus biogenesis/stability protein PilW [Aliiglaciecola sp. LCG003]